MWVIVGCGDDVEYASALGPFDSKQAAHAEMKKFELTPHDADTAWQAVEVETAAAHFYDPYLEVQRGQEPATAAAIIAATSDIGGPYFAATGKHPYRRDNFANMLIEGDSWPTAENRNGSTDIEVPGIGIARKVDEDPNLGYDDYQGPLWIVFSLAGKLWRIPGESVLDPADMYIDDAYGNLWFEDKLHEVTEHVIPAATGKITVYAPVG